MTKTFIALPLAVALAASTIAVPALGASASSAAAAKPAKVELIDSLFQPDKITIKKGAKVTWKWTGFLPHNVTVKSGPAKFHSKTQTSGSYSKAFTKPGTYKIVCTLHEDIGMKMTVVVKK